jgi:hypothetical protein
MYFKAGSQVKLINKDGSNVFPKGYIPLTSGICSSKLVNSLIFDKKFVFVYQPSMLYHFVFTEFETVIWYGMVLYVKNVQS